MTLLSLSLRSRHSWVHGVLFLGLLTILGCVNPLTRIQTPEEIEKEKDLDVRTIGDITYVNNVGPMSISGVGLVTGLTGTGGSPPPSNEFRKLLKDHLLKQKIKNVEELLESKDNAMVLVSALIPAGARKGDPLDVDVALPVGSRAVSLRGGYLEPCLLQDYDTTKNIKPDYQGSNKLLLGHVLGHAHGPLLVGFTGKGAEPAQLRQGRIWAGGVSNTDRPFFLVLNNDQRFASVANAIAQRINFMFQDDPQKRANLLRNRRLLILDNVTKKINQKFAGPTGNHGIMARAYNKEIVNVNVPFTYRFNAQRYLRVVRLIPLQEAPEKQERYRRRLEKMLLDPAETVRAALRLEALGRESVPVLQRGLTSEHALVRFTAAEALAYLGSTAGCEQLARLAERHPVLRAYCLLALAGLEEAICRHHLSEMLAAPEAELRCGAFQALRLLDETDKHLGGELLNNSFWVHKVAPNSTPMVFFAIRQRAEIVLFGSDIHLTPPARVLAGEFIVTADPGDVRCTVSRFQTQQGNVVRRQCSMLLEDILQTMAELGGQYPDAVQFLSKVEEYHCLSCPVRCRTLPQEVPVETLAQNGKDPDFLKEP